jgi:pimeloyl-ACP methyl ester carboxylesterase
LIINFKCLHGWQDNAGTFDKLIPLLPQCHSYLAIDLPGHGKSSHYPKGMIYYLFWDGIVLIRRIAKYHNWSKISLMGHSLGGALSFMYASIFNNETDVSKLIMIDIAGPTVRDQKQLSENAATCIDRMLQYENYPITKIPSYNYEDSIDIVVDAYDGSVGREGVKTLMIRGMAPAPKHLNKEGYHFARDLRLKVSTLAMFNEEQVLHYAKQIKCEVLNIRGKPGMSFGDPNVYPKVITCLRENASRVVYEEVEGTHHLHLETPQRIFKIVSDFILSDPDIDEREM